MQCNQSNVQDSTVQPAPLSLRMGITHARVPGGRPAGKLSRDDAQGHAHTWFLTRLVELRSRANAFLCDLRPSDREEAVADVLASIFRTALNAARRGTLDRVTPYRAVYFAARQYRHGRRFAGYSSTDVTAEAARFRGRASVVSMYEPRGARTAHHTGTELQLSDVLSDHREESPVERARQSLDYPEILDREQVSLKAKRVFHLLSSVRGLGSIERIARDVGVTAGRVCHLKGQLADALARHGYEPPPQRKTHPSVKASGVRHRGELPSKARPETALAG